MSSRNNHKSRKDMDESIRIVPDTTWIRGSSRNLHNSNSNSNSNSNNNSFNLETAGNKSVTFGKSVSFGTDNSNNNNNNSGSNLGGSRVAMMKAKLRDSFSANTMVADDSKNNDSFKRNMEASWGGALALVEDLSLSDSDSDDDSLGDFAGGNTGMDESLNFRKQAQQSVSFNMSFMHVGLDGSNNEDLDGSNKTPPGMSSSSRRREVPKKVTGRGSIFVLADEKFGKTKVVQSRLEKAAKKLQRFFRRCLLVLRQYSDEVNYLRNEIQDIELRRREELTDIIQFIQDEKEQFRMEMEREWNADMWSPEEWAAHDQEQADLKAEIQTLKEENQTIKTEGKKLKHDNDKLAIVDPTKESERTQLEIQVQKLEIDNADWARIQTTYQTALEDAQRKVDYFTEKRKQKRAHRKRMAKAIDKIIKLLEEHPTEPIDNPKVLAKVNKLKDKREKKMLKLKAKTIMEQQRQQQQLEGINEDEEHAHEQAEADHEKEQLEKQKRKERRRSKKLDAEDDGPPELSPAATAEGNNGAEAGGESSKKKKSKKKDKSLEDVITTTDRSSTKEDGASVDGASVDGESALMMMYKAQQQQQAKNVSGDEAAGEASPEPIKKKRSKKKNKSFDDSMTMKDRSSKQDSAPGPEGNNDEAGEIKKKKKSKDKSAEGQAPEGEVEGGEEGGKSKKKKSRRKTVSGSGDGEPPPAHSGALFALFTS